ncbi:MAG: C-OmpA-like family protein CmpA [Legionellales bacterium]
MSLNLFKTRNSTTTNTRILCGALMISMLSSCYHPPYNNFRPDHDIARRAAAGATVGAVAGVVAAGTLTGTLIGAAAGGSLGIAIGLQKNSKPNLIRQLKKQDIQYVVYGDTMTLLIPTDKYFMFNSPRLNELHYPALTNIVKLLKLYPQSLIYVAGFTDNVGSPHHKKLLSQAQAETMLTYLWANDIAAQKLKAEGYGDKNDISDNHLIHGSAQNRRIEIQWFFNAVEHA